MTASASASAARRPGDDVPWDIGFVRTGALTTMALLAVAVPITGLAAGWADAAGVALGAVIVTAFFAVSSLAVAWAGRAIGDTFTLPVALLAFFLKAVVLFGVLNALPQDGSLDRRTLAWTVVVGALVWSGVQLRWVWTRQLYYVPPPAPPSVQPPVAGEGVVGRAGTSGPDGPGTGG